MALATIARSNGFACEMDYLGRSLKAQFKASDRSLAKVVAILGEDEVSNSQVTLKNTRTKEQITISYFDLVSKLNNWLYEQEEVHNHDDSCTDHTHHH